MTTLLTYRGQRTTTDSTRRMSAEDYCNEIDEAASVGDYSRWELAELATRARDLGLTNWDELMAKRPLVRRHASRVRHWAAAYDFLSRDLAAVCDHAQLVNLRARLPFSAFEAAASYRGRLEPVILAEALDTYAESDGETVEGLRSFLSNLAGVTSTSSDPLPVWILGRDPLPDGAAVVCLPGPACDWEGLRVRVRVIK